MNKAKKIFTMYDKYSNTVTYEYRGHQYDVEYPTCNSYCCTSPKIQHENAQYKIDKMIENEGKNEETKSFDLDEIWSLLGWD